MNPQKAALQFHKKENTNEYSEEIIQASFLIPIREDKDFGEGRIHSDSKWNHLEDELYVKFGGFTRASNLYQGGWVNPKTKKRIEDISRKYFVDVKRKKLSMLVSLLVIINDFFKQNCIRLESDGRVQYVEKSIQKLFHYSSP